MERLRVEWSPVAFERVEEIAEYIRRDKPGAAHRWLISVFEASDSLAEYAERGREVPEVGRTDIRELILDGYRLIYRVGDHAVLILTVRHGRQVLRPDELAAGSG